jgi:cytoskeletal protein CcmA (bactofilin family)
MATAYTTSLKLALPTQGELTGTWGDTLNNQVTSMVEEAVAGLKTIDTWSTNSATLSTADGSTSESRAAILNLTDTTSDLSGAATLICPAVSKVYIIKNGTGETVTVKTASGSGIAISNGNTSMVFCDGTNVVEAVTGITGNLDVGGNLTVGGNATVTGTTTFNGGTLTLGDSAADNVVFGADVNSSIIPNTDDTYDLGSASQEWRDIYIDGTAYLDGINFNGTAVTSTATEVNILDGDTSASSVIVADADRVVLNDGGTMKQVAVTDLAAYFDDEITAMPNLITTAATTVGVLDSGSITSGFGTIDTGASAITTTGLISGGSLDIDSVLINGANIGHTDDTDLITVANGIVTVAGEISVTTLDIGGTNVTASAADINLIDGITNGTVIASKALIADANIDITGGRNITITGELDAGSLDISGDVDVDGTLEADAITVNGTALATVIAGTTVTNATNSAHVLVTDNESTNEENLIAFVEGATSITGNVGLEMDGNFAYNPSTGTVSATVFKGNIDAVDGDFDGTLEADAITVGGTALASVIAGTTVANATLAASVTVTDSTANTNFPIVFHDESNALLDDTGALRYNPSTGELLVPKLTVAGTTTTVDTVTMNAANAIIFEGATADAHETTLTIVDPTADRTINLPNQSGTLPVLAAASNTAVTSTPEELNILDGATVVVGEINALDLGSTAVGTAIASKAVILDSNKDYTGIRNITTTGVVTVGSQLIMPDVTSAKILVADGTSYQEVAISGDITIANTGAVTIAATSVEGSMLNTNVISGQTELASGIADTDELLISDAGTIKRTDMSVIKTYIGAADDATALAIALG